MPGIKTPMMKSFSAKVFTYLLGAMILIAGTFNYFYLQFQRENLEKEISKDGTVLSGILANNARLGIFAENKRQISVSLLNAISVEGVISACAFNIEGHLLVRESRQGWEKSSICSNGKNVSTDIIEVLEKEGDVIQLENEKVVEFWSLVKSKPDEFTDEALYFKDGENVHPGQTHIIGLVGVIFDKSPIQKSIREILTKNILILLFFLVIGCFAAYYIIQAVTRPLNQLIANIKTSGLKVEAKDELGMLADTFSGMIITLNNSFETTNELKKGLEKKVAELEQEIITRRKMEAALLESEEKFRGISEGIADGVAIVQGGKIIWLNKSFTYIFGYDPDELIGLEPEILFSPAHLKQSSKQMQNWQPDQISDSRYQVDAYRKNDEKIFVEVNAQKIIFENNAAIQVIVRDVTELDMAERERKELEVKALSQSKLASLGKIATGVAHEINQPLSFIKIVYESTLRDIGNRRLDQDEITENFKEALRQVNRITQITDHLRSFGRTDTSLLSETRMPDILANSLTLMGESLRLADISLIQEIEDNLPSILGNSVQLEQVFINLFQNSVDAMNGTNNKKIQIAIKQAGPMIKISISDTGPGILPEVVEGMFEPFFTTKRLEDRTGLGLAIVNNIIKEHNGTIEYQQKTGWGQALLFCCQL